MTVNVGIAQLLAASDWQTIVAIIVFTLISIVANWVKKRSEAKAPSPTQADAGEEFEPVELFEEPKPIRRTIVVARPSPPPIVTGERRHLSRPAETPASNRSRASEAQDHVYSTLPMPKVSMASAVALAGKARRRQEPDRGTIPEAAIAEPPKVIYQEFLNLRNPKSVRQAVIAAELLKPPLALRGDSELPGLCP